MRPRSWWPAALGALPLALLMGVHLAGSIDRLFDPCAEWGIDSAGAVRLGNPECPEGMRGTGISRSTALRDAILVDAGSLALLGLGVFAAVRRDQKLILAAAIGLSLESLIFLRSVVGPFFWIAAGMFLVAARAVERPAGWTVWPGRIVGLAAALWAGNMVARVALDWSQHGTVSLLDAWLGVLLVGSPVFLTLTGWWPSTRRGAEAGPMQ